MGKRVLMALSGGVDSSAGVYLLKQQGYEVGGVVLKMSPAHEETVAAAKEAAAALGVPLFVKDMTEAFEQTVVSYFMEEYKAGRTPNPCIRCNPTVKFRALLETADEQGYGWIATGHYAGLERKDGVTWLKRAECRRRDQSYMLYRLGQDVLSRLILPLAGLEKPQVRELARQAGLSCADKPDSQEICFIPDNDYAGFIERRLGPSPEGEFIAPWGGVCGKHRGILHYTVGQRKKLGIALGEPVFIREIDPQQNRIYLARAGEDTITKVTLADFAIPSEQPLPERFSARVKLRSAAEPVETQVVFDAETRSAELLLAEPYRVVAKGQSAVLYDGDTVLGGGIISGSE